MIYFSFLCSTDIYRESTHAHDCRLSSFCTPSTPFLSPFIPTFLPSLPLCTSPYVCPIFFSAFAPSLLSTTGIHLFISINHTALIYALSPISMIRYFGYRSAQNKALLFYAPSLHIHAIYILIPQFLSL